MSHAEAPEYAMPLPLDPTRARLIRAQTQVLELTSALNLALAELQLSRQEWQEREALAASHATPSSDGRLLTTKEAAAYLGIGASLMSELMRRGEVETIRFGHVVRIQPSAVDAFIREHARQVRREEMEIDTYGGELGRLYIAPRARKRGPRNRSTQNRTDGSSTAVRPKGA